MKWNLCKRNARFSLFTLSYLPFFLTTHVFYSQPFHLIIQLNHIPTYQVHSSLIYSHSDVLWSLIFVSKKYNGSLKHEKLKQTIPSLQKKCYISDSVISKFMYFFIHMYICTDVDINQVTKFLSKIDGQYLLIKCVWKVWEKGQTLQVYHLTFITDRC